MPTSPKDLSGLTLLGRDAKPGKTLETFPNHDPGRRYTITLSTDEFLRVPGHRQPDFRRSRSYIPDKRILESKS
jgi:7-cyano-7-deazaguanine reductase